MANPSKILSLEILDREYRINCPDGAEYELREAARALDEKMTEIREASSRAGKVLSTDRIAVIAALNITHQLRETEASQAKVSEHIERLNHRIDVILDADSQLEL
ncbi:MAG: cell division protein ZapA [Thalassolituus sp.]|nr:cell division protein ZapA [Thalassolituus sp.]